VGRRKEVKKQSETSISTVVLLAPAIIPLIKKQLEYAIATMEVHDAFMTTTTMLRQYYIKLLFCHKSTVL
jgi:hypothetical protein